MNLHKFDCLRANKSTSAWGIEPRVPFLDADFVELGMSQHCFALVQHGKQIAVNKLHSS
jgi:asparagine synthetase B (glutamine-hydrolysing)